MYVNKLIKLYYIKCFNIIIYNYIETRWKMVPNPNDYYFLNYYNLFYYINLRYIFLIV